MANQKTDLRCYLTNAGIAAENNAIALGRKLPIKEMVFGSGLLPDGDDPRQQTALIKEELAVPCAMVTHDDNPTLLTFKGDIPVDQGGFHINEVAIRLEDGTLYNYARSTGDYKPTPEQGATESIRYVVDMYTNNAGTLECKVDLSGVYADYEDLEKCVKKSDAATNADIDNESVAPKHVNLPELWRAFKKAMVRTSTPQENPNTLLESGAYRVEPHDNNPTPDHFYSYIVFGNGINVIGQIAISVSSLKAYTRTYNTGWTDWTALYSSVNKPTKSDVGLDKVENYEATSSITDGSTTKYLLAKAAKVLNDKLTTGFTLSDAGNGYIKFPDFLGGFIIQWGKRTDSTITGSVSFPITFPDLAYTVIGTSTFDNGSIAVMNIGAVGFSYSQLHGGQNGAGPFNWIAIGK